MFERDRDPRRDDERDVDVQEEDRGSTGSSRRTGPRHTGGTGKQGSSSGRSGSSSQKKK